MSFEAEQVKNAKKIRLYVYLDQTQPSVHTVPIVEISPSNFDDFCQDIFATNFLEYNKITLSDRTQQFSYPDSVLAYKIVEHPKLWNDLEFAFKAFLPPHSAKVEFLDSNDDVIYVKNFSVYNDNNDLIEADITYAKWFIYSIAGRIVDNAEEIPTEAYCFEPVLHYYDTNAHAKDIVTLPMQLDNRLLGCRDSIYYSLYEQEINSNAQAIAQVVNGNLITKDYQLFYLGNNIYDGTDEINTVVSWATNKRNPLPEPPVPPTPTGSVLEGVILTDSISGNNNPVILGGVIPAT